MGIQDSAASLAATEAILAGAIGKVTGHQTAAQAVAAQAGQVYLQAQRGAPGVGPTGGPSGGSPPPMVDPDALAPPPPRTGSGGGMLWLLAGVLGLLVARKEGWI
jgi:hypothetical protein